MACLVLAVCAGLGSGQAILDRFDYLPSTTIPNWATEFGGDWQATGAELQGDVKVGWHFLIRDQVQDRDCVVENVCRYDSPPHLQFAGTVARATLQASVLRCYMAKIQDNTRQGAGFFNRAFLYYYTSPLGMLRLAYADVTGSTLVRNRLLVMDEGNAVRVMGFWDTDMDGVWDVRLSAAGLAQRGVAGGVGVNGFSRNFSDDWKYFDAVLYARNPGARPGETVELVARGAAGAPYYAASSFSNTGFRVGGKTVPLFPDGLMVLSLALPTIFQNYAGILDANGDALLKVAIPGDPVLTGVVFYTAFVTLSPTPPSTVLEVSNDAQVRIGG